MAAPKEIGRKPNGMGECRPSCGCVKLTSWKYHSTRNTFSSKSLVHQISAVTSDGTAACQELDLVLYGGCDAVVLNSIVNISQALPILNEYSQVFCHLDNDAAGRMGTRQIATALGEKCNDMANEYEGNKDLNEYLMSNAVPQRYKSFVR